MGKVSIIVAVYKAEKYIHKCFDSILAQTYTDFEAILVDDGSPDNSGKICDEYAAKDARFKVIHQQNGGVSVARQAGLDAAQGEYVIHVDPDDWIEANMLEEMVAKIEEKGADMVFCDYFMDGDLDSEYCSQNPNCKCNRQDIIPRLIDGRLYGTCWNKLYKTACLKDVQFSPVDICLAEDLLFNIRAIVRDIKIVYFPKAFYHYTRYSNSSTLVVCVSKKSLDSTIKVFNEITKIQAISNFITEENLDFRKRSILGMLFQLKQFDTMMHLYPECRDRFISKPFHYSIYTPNSSCLSIALRGYPRIAFILFQLNILLIKLVKYIKLKYRSINNISLKHRFL